MKLTPIQANMTELELMNGYILFSYKTPVASTMKSTGEYFKTSKFWSKTTSRHMNKWFKEFGEIKIQEKPQEYFDDLLNEVK